MRNYFSFSVPKELEEAALLDGCSEFTSFFRVVMPLSRSMMAAVGLFIAVIHWNDYYSYMMYISNKPELRNGAVNMGFDLPPPMGLRMATIICAVIPIVVVYPFIQPFFTSGMTLGAVKE